MSREQHVGQLKLRKSGYRKPDLGYYYIITNAVETEPNYFNGLKNDLPERLKGRLVIKVKSTKTYDMVDTMIEALNKSAIYYDPWIVFDKDQIKDFDKLIEKAENNNIHIGWSNPCIEVLFLSYFEKSPSVFDQKDCINKFAFEYKKNLGKDYKKNEEKIYSELCMHGNEGTAIEIQDKKYNNYIDQNINKPSQMAGVSTVYKLLKEISNKKRM